MADGAGAFHFRLVSTAVVGLVLGCPGVAAGGDVAWRPETAGAVGRALAVLPASDDEGSAAEAAAAGGVQAGVASAFASAEFRVAQGLGASSLGMVCAATGERPCTLYQWRQVKIGPTIYYEEIGLDTNLRRHWKITSQDGLFTRSGSAPLANDAAYKTAIGKVYNEAAYLHKVSARLLQGTSQDVNSLYSTTWNRHMAEQLENARVTFTGVMAGMIGPTGLVVTGAGVGADLVKDPTFGTAARGTASLSVHGASEMFREGAGIVGNRAAQVAAQGRYPEVAGILSDTSAHLGRIGQRVGAVGQIWTVAQGLGSFRAETNRFNSNLMANDRTLNANLNGALTISNRGGALSDLARNVSAFGESLNTLSFDAYKNGPGFFRYSQAMDPNLTPGLRALAASQFAQGYVNCAGQNPSRDTIITRCLDLGEAGIFRQPNGKWVAKDMILGSSHNFAIQQPYVKTSDRIININTSIPRSQPIITNPNTRTGGRGLP